MNITQALFLSFIEGVTEFLPVSSTAHLVLTSQLLGIAQSEFVKSFEIIIQLGAILAVVVLYFKELVKNACLWYKTILAFLPSALVGFVLYDLIKGSLIGNSLITALALIVGGFIFILLDKLFHETFLASKNTLANISVRKLLMIGLFQSLAVVPGVSRAAASIFGGLLMGLNRKEATKFSFFLAIPTMLAAASLDVYKSSFSFSQQEFLILSVGFVGAFLTALLTVKLFISFVQKHSFRPFGIYRIIIGMAWLLLA